MTTDLNQVRESLTGLKTQAEEVKGAEALTMKELEELKQDRKFDNQLAIAHDNIDNYLRDTEGASLNVDVKKQEIVNLLKEVMDIQDENDPAFRELANELGLLTPVIKAEQGGKGGEVTPKVEKFTSPEAVEKARTDALGILEQVKGSIEITGENQDKKRKILDNVFATLKERVQSKEPSLPTFEELKTLAIQKANAEVGMAAAMLLDIPGLINGLLEKQEIKGKYEEAKKVLDSVSVDSTKKSTALENMSEGELNNVDTLIDSIPKDAWEDVPEGQTKSLGDLYKEAVMSGYKENYDKWEADKYPPDMFKKFGRMIGGLFEKLGKFLGPLFSKLSGLPVIGDALGFLKGFLPEKKEEEIPDAKKAIQKEIKEAKNKIEWTNADSATFKSFNTFRDGGKIETSAGTMVLFPPMKELLGFIDGLPLEKSADYKSISVADFEGWYKNTPPQVLSLLTWAYGKKEKNDPTFSKISRDTWEALLKSTAKITVSADNKTAEFGSSVKGARSITLETWSDAALRKVLGLEVVAGKSKEVINLYAHSESGIGLESMTELWEGEGETKKLKEFLVELADPKMEPFWGSYRLTQRDLENLKNHAGGHGNQGMKALDDADIGVHDVQFILEIGKYIPTELWHWNGTSLSYDDSSNAERYFEVSAGGWFDRNPKFDSVESFFTWLGSGIDKVNGKTLLFDPNSPATIGDTSVNTKSPSGNSDTEGEDEDEIDK